MLASVPGFLPCFQQLLWRRLIKDFEREARVDNLPPLDLASRKKLLVQELNGFITAKKEFTQTQAAKSELIGTGVGGSTPRAGSPGLTPRSKDGQSWSSTLQSSMQDPSCSSYAPHNSALLVSRRLN